MNKLTFLFCILFISLSSLTSAQDISGFFSRADSFFKKYIKDGRVDYNAIHQNPDAMNGLVKMAEKISVSKEDANKFQAFWINGYNLMVIKGVVDNYPLKSPMDIKGFFDAKKRSIGGKQMTLNDIENQLLRKNFPDEPRFHFVLVCGALGCPPIIANAYLPSTLDAQLEAQTKKALNNPDFIQVDKNKVKVSQIFEWYKEDFTHGGQTITGFIDKYKSEKLPENTKVSYYPYDWTLNGRN